MTASELSIDGSVRVKLRNPRAVFAADLFTLGGYGMYWHAKLSHELADLGRVRHEPMLGENPRNSALAMFPGLLLVVPALVSLFRGVKRVARAQEIAELPEEERVDTRVGFALLMVFPPAGSAYLQRRLNAAWRSLAG